jgi:translation elongation factor EF-4
MCVVFINNSDLGAAASLLETGASHLIQAEENPNTHYNNIDIRSGNENSHDKKIIAHENIKALKKENINKDIGKDISKNKKIIEKPKT